MIRIEFNFDYNNSIYNKNCFNKGVKVLQDIACAYQLELDFDYIKSNNCIVIKHTIELDETSKDAIVKIINEMFVLKKNIKESSIKNEIVFTKI